jgi:hypothetical protein
LWVVGGWWVVGGRGWLWVARGAITMTSRSPPEV